MIQKIRAIPAIPFSRLASAGILGAFLLLFSNSLSGRTGGSVEDGVRSDLLRHGFENVAVVRDSAGWIVAYENRVVRFEARALREALQIVARRVERGGRCVLIPQNRGVPLIAVSADSAVLSFCANAGTGEALPASGFAASLDVEPYWTRVRGLPRENSPYRKADIVVHPQFRAQFGNVLDAVQSQVNLAPAVSTVPAGGLSVSAQWIFPLQNELGYEGDHDRPGFLTVNQTVRMSGRTFVSGTIGYFSEHRYGADLEILKFSRNGRWAADFNAGFTGFAAWVDRGWIYSDPADWTFFCEGAYRVPSLDLTLKAGAGKFTYQDNGVRVEAVRQFGETSVGFYAVDTNRGKNGGFSVSIPVFPSRRLSPRRIRVGPALVFPWSYRYRGLPDFGIRYETQNGLDDFMKGLNPDFVKSRLSIREGRE
jgi:hypothetical protein